jgi:hypothetical protein
VRDRFVVNSGVVKGLIARVERSRSVRSTIPTTARSRPNLTAGDKLVVEGATGAFVMEVVK